MATATKRDARGRPIPGEMRVLERPEDNRKIEQREKEDRQAEFQNAMKKANANREKERATMSAPVKALVKSGRTCENCRWCDIRVTGFCVNLGVRDQLHNWDSVIEVPAQFGCGLFAPREEKKE